MFVHVFLSLFLSWQEQQSGCRRSLDGDWCDWVAAPFWRRAVELTEESLSKREVLPSSFSTARGSTVAALFWCRTFSRLWAGASAGRSRGCIDRAAWVPRGGPKCVFVHFSARLAHIAASGLTHSVDTQTEIHHWGFFCICTAFLKQICCSF